MSGKTVSADKFSEAVAKAVEETKELTEDALHKAVDQTAKEIVRRTKDASPVRTGEYKKGWNAQKTSDTARGSYGKTVANRTRYMLTHLLQNGHGGPVKAGPIPHIPSDDLTEQLFRENLAEAMK